MCSFVNPRLVPGWADAEAVVQGFTATKGVNYTGLYFNSRGLERALEYKDKLNFHGYDTIDNSNEEIEEAISACSFEIF